MMMKRRGFRLLLGFASVLVCAGGAANAESAAQRDGVRSGASAGAQRFQFTQPRSFSSRPAAFAGQGNANRAVSGVPAQARGRSVSDQDHAQYRLQRGQVLPLQDLLRTAERVGRGEYLGVEPNVSDNRYRFKFMRSGGNVVWVDVDARTGDVISIRE